MRFILGLGISGGLLVGGAAGYFFAKKQLKSHFAMLANEEITEVKAHYQKLLKTGVYSSPVTLFVEKYGDTVDGLGYDTEQEKQEPVEYLEESHALTEVPLIEVPLVTITSTPVRDVMTRRERENAGYNESPAIRDPDRPYVISVEEFMEQEDVYDKLTITYFEGDGTLCDERDEVVDDVEGTVGSDSFSQFGFKSDDENVVYVRNERLKTDFEVILDKQKYIEVVVGYHEKDEHVEIRRMRDDD